MLKPKIFPNFQVSTWSLVRSKDDITSRVYFARLEGSRDSGEDNVVITNHAYHPDELVRVVDSLIEEYFKEIEFYEQDIC